MRTESHITKDIFFSIIERRLFKYMEAIWGNHQSVNIASYIYHNIERLKTLNAYDNFCGIGFWGYGINNISDGKESYSHLDVEDIRKLPELNKHHQPYRQLLLLTFKIEDSGFFVSTFSIESCQSGVNSNINTKYDLKDFSNARIVTRNGKTIIEVSFVEAEKPVSFQIDDYYFPQNLSGNDLAKYYIDTIKIKAKEVIQKEKAFGKSRVFDFLKDFIRSIDLLQKQDVNADCIRKLKEENKKDESAFRYWFQMAFSMAGYTAEAEPQKGRGRIDLKVTHPLIANKIIEFKGWWNYDKKNIIQQLKEYLTDFEQEGYIFMINHKQENIEQHYKDIITSEEIFYAPGSWKRIVVEPSQYFYFQSEHNFNRKKIINHFIFSVE